MFYVYKIHLVCTNYKNEVKWLITNAPKTICWKTTRHS